MTKALLLLVLLQGPGISPEVLESRIFDLINAERVQNKLKPLRVNAKLTNLARAHSRDMARRSFFDHLNPNGLMPADRARAAGITCQRPLDGRYALGIAENIFQNNLYDRVIFHNDKPTYEWKPLDEIAMSTVRGWMGSPGHRKVILTPNYLTAGVGVAIASNDQILITQEFC